MHDISPSRRIVRLLPLLLAAALGMLIPACAYRAAQPPEPQPQIVVTVNSQFGIINLQENNQ